MPYLIQGNSHDVFHAFNREWMAESGTTKEDIDRDLPRTYFFGDANACQYHIDTWQDEQISDHLYYTQGNMSAGNLYLLLADHPFYQTDEDIISYSRQIAKLDFAFVDTNHMLNGLSLYYRQDDPSQWMIGLIKGTNHVPHRRTIFLLTSQKLVPTTEFVESNMVTLVDATDTTLIDNVCHPLLTQFLSIILANDGTININCNIFEHFTQNVASLVYFMPNDQLLQALDNNIPAALNNNALQKLQQLGLQAKPKNAYDCLNPNSDLVYLIGLLTKFSIDERTFYDQILRQDHLIINFQPLISHMQNDLKIAYAATLIDFALTARHSALANDMIDLLLENSPKGKLFLRTIAELETGCQAIRYRLSAKSPEKYEQIRQAEQDYRIGMYHTLYNYILDPECDSKCTSLADTIKQIEEPFLMIANVDRHPWLRKSLLIITNAITLVLTAGQANKKHQEKSGDFYFFSRPNSSEALRTLDIKIIDIVNSPTCAA